MFLFSNLEGGRIEGSRLDLRCCVSLVLNRVDGDEV